MRKHPHLTLQLLWEEYRAQQPGGYGYSRFCELYRRWQETRDVVLRKEHRAGEKLFVDWAGAKIPLFSPEAGACPSRKCLPTTESTTYARDQSPRYVHVKNVTSEPRQRI